jgi:hypothetical protein
MTFESAFDRRAMVSVSDWGTKAIYKASGTRYTITGIFDKPYRGVNVTDAEFASNTPIFTIPTASLPCKPAVGDYLLLDKQSYKVRNFRADGTGITVLHLEYLTELEIATVNNLLTEAGGNMLLEDGGFILLELRNA